MFNDYLVASFLDETSMHTPQTLFPHHWVKFMTSVTTMKVLNLEASRHSIFSRSSMFLKIPIRQETAIMRHCALTRIISAISLRCTSSCIHSQGRNYHCTYNTLKSFRDKCCIIVQPVSVHRNVSM